jgi:hypothetical protein
VVAIQMRITQRVDELARAVAANLRDHHR